MSLRVRKSQVSREKILGKLKYMGSTKLLPLEKPRIENVVQNSLQLVAHLPITFWYLEFIAGESICLYARNFNENHEL